MTQHNPFTELNVKLEAIKRKLDRLADRPETPSPGVERYLTTDQFCDALNISRVTLWSWDKKGITRPVRVGNLKRYRLSDLEVLARES